MMQYSLRFCPATRWWDAPARNSINSLQKRTSRSKCEKASVGRIEAVKPPGDPKVRPSFIVEYPISSTYGQETDPNNKNGSRRFSCRHHEEADPCDAAARRTGKWALIEAVPVLPGSPWKLADLSHFPQTHVLRHFLPSGYPVTVAPGYGRFALAAWGASIFGSASMVLSTQILLLAVGAVGPSEWGPSTGADPTSSNTGSTTRDGDGSNHSWATAPVMAGALNWVLKDGVGQLGGVLVVSRMGDSRRLDANPKQWRMIAAVLLDAASLLELLSPWAAPSGLVLPVACVANILKNVGFLTSSASRAALHQSLAVTGNLADVTAKSGSQGMAAGLLGTGLGIGLSTLVLRPDPVQYLAGFCLLSLLHQGLNLASLHAVALHHFNRQRLHLVLRDYLSARRNEKKQAQDRSDLGTAVHKPSMFQKALTPQQVAEQESFWPWTREGQTWLCIGRPLEDSCPGGWPELKCLLDAVGPQASYFVNYALLPSPPASLWHQSQARGDHLRIHLVFLQGAENEDLLKGMWHAHLLHQHLVDLLEEEEMFQPRSSHEQLVESRATKQPSFLHRKMEILSKIGQQARQDFPLFRDALVAAGWSQKTGLHAGPEGGGANGPLVVVESSQSRRIAMT